MSVTLIANPKGGCGKSTLATNLAAWHAWQGDEVALADLDRQQSSRRWLEHRSLNFPAIERWDIDPDDPRETHCAKAVIDSPAGLHGKRLDAAIKLADRVLVPVQPSSFDMWASEAFFARLSEEKAVRKGRLPVAVVGMRVNARTVAARELARFLEQFDLPVLTCLRETQLYVQTLPRGLGIFDLPAPKIERDLAEWQPIFTWLK